MAVMWVSYGHDQYGNVLNVLSISTGDSTNGQYRGATTTASGGAANAANSANTGTGSVVAILSGGTAGNYGTYAVENAGIRAGEIIAYRCWKLLPREKLGSVFVKNIWQPRATEKSHEVPEAVGWGVGIHCFKDIGYARAEYSNYSPVGPMEPMVYGEIAIWGTVIEHQWGYRAEFAKITRIHSITTKSRLRDSFPFSQLKRLRERYGV